MMESKCKFVTPMSSSSKFGMEAEPDVGGSWNRTGVLILSVAGRSRSANGEFHHTFSAFIANIQGGRMCSLRSLLKMMSCVQISN